jgi:hypothetical protein
MAVSLKKDLRLVDGVQFYVKVNGDISDFNVWDWHHGKEWQAHSVVLEGTVVQSCDS